MVRLARMRPAHVDERSLDANFRREVVSPTGSRRRAQHAHNGIDTATVPLPHGAEARLAAEVPHGEVDAAVSHLIDDQADRRRRRLVARACRRSCAGNGLQRP